MKSPTLFLSSVALAVAQSFTSSSIDMSMSNMSMSIATSSTSASPDYTITALPAVMSAPSCLFNCLIPIGLADPSGCGDISNDCACLSAPADVLDFLTGCVETVCQSSTSALGASATSLYESYCNSVYGTAVFTSAFEAEASAAASSSIASVEASSTSASLSASGKSNSSSSTSASASSTAKSGTMVWSPSMFTAGLAAAGGLALLVSL